LVAENNIGRLNAERIAEVVLMSQQKQPGSSVKSKDLLLSDESALGKVVPMGVKDPRWKGIPRRLRLVRTRLELYGHVLSERSGLALGTVRDIEHGQIPAIDTMEKLAAAAGLPPGWLAFGPEGSEVFQKHRPRDLTLDPDPEPRAEGLPFQEAYLHCAERLRQRRYEMGFSMATLADATTKVGRLWRGLTKQSISRIEDGTHIAPRVDTLEVLAIVLKVPPSWLAYGEGTDSGSPTA
jgi:transcriptional regulator with XRE-family HTH domain